ncbi:MAG: T9SS type A sorting domain-containing protein, partial [Bacteroidetes bacterium]|nr:T9SS type A sorting domain-containing protein [Bacteroidota bacterium]
MKSIHLTKLLVLSIFITALNFPVLSQPVWTQKSNYSGVARFDFAGFSLNGKGYIGGGRYGGPFNSISEWQEYNPVSDSWNIITPMTYPFTALSAFEIAGTGYVMNGVNDAFYNYDTFRYNQAGNNWSTGAQNNYPRLYASGVSNGVKGYIIGGYGFSAESLNDLWEYNPVLDAWTEKDTLPLSAARYYASAFSILGNVYVFGGTNDFGNLNDLWKYDTATTHWTQMSSMPSVERMQSLSFVINNEAYVVGGSLNGTNSKEVWKYDAITDTWTALPDFPGLNAPFGGVAFTINGKGYIVTGNGTSECWEFDPGINNTTENPAESITVSLSPNPVVGISVLQFKERNTAGYTIEITNSLGVIVKTLRTNLTEVFIDRKELTTGIYFARIHDQSF